MSVVQPKVKYTLLGAEYEIVFSPALISDVRYRFIKDELEVTHPFTRRKRRRSHGYYFMATIFFPGLTNEQLAGFRDLFNKNTTNIVIYPNTLFQEHYECDTNTDLTFDEWYATHKKNFFIEFRSKDVFDSPLDYPETYWGTRKIRFVDNAPFEAHRAALMTADTTNKTNAETAQTNINAHITGGHAVMYYTKTQLDAAIVNPTKRISAVFAKSGIAWATAVMDLPTETAVLTFRRALYNYTLEKVIIRVNNLAVQPTTGLNIAITKGKRLRMTLRINTIALVAKIYLYQDETIIWSDELDVAEVDFPIAVCANLCLKQN